MFNQEEEEEEFTEQFNNFKPSYVLIAIDTDSSMFEEKTELSSEERLNKDKPSTHFHDALYACFKVGYGLLLTSGVRNYNDFGVVLVGTDPKKATLVEIKANMLEKTRMLFDEYQKPTAELMIYKRDDKIDLAAFFQICRRKFRDIEGDYYRQTIILITNDNNPIKDDPQLKFTVMHEAKSVDKSDIRVELVSLREDFDYSKFWNEFFNGFQNPPDFEVFCEDRYGLRRRLKNWIIYRYTPIKCKLFPFKNDFQKHLQCKRVNFIRPAKLYNTHRMSTDGKLLMRVHSGEPFVPQYRVNLGNAELESFNPKERYEMYYNNLPLGLHLQYVADRQTEVGITVGRPGLIMMDDKEELSNFYDNFWGYCVDNNKVLVCIKKYKHPCPIRYVELIPKFANDRKMFLVKHLPFVEEILFPNKRTVLTRKPENIQPPTETQLEAARKLFAGLTCHYEPKLLYDVTHSRKKRYLKTKLLENMVYTDPGDCCENLSAMGEILETELQAVKHLFGFGRAPDDKRKGATLPNSKVKRRKQ